MSPAQCFDERFVCGFEYAAVVFESGEELSATFSSDGFVLLGECLRVLFETFDTKELGLKRLFVSVVRRFTDHRHQRF
jgi:hypothetical protein